MRLRTPTLKLATVLTLLATSVLAVGTARQAADGAPAPAAVAAASIPRPAADPFYSYDRSRLAGKPNGTVLRKRSVTLALQTTADPVPALQLLYKTVDSVGDPTYSATTVIPPATGTVAPRLVSYQSFYDALSSKCNPSYTLRGGDPGAANAQLTEAEQAAVHDLWAGGYVVNVPDFENIDLDWVAGVESGRSTLDSIRAATAALKLPRTTPIGLMGYSGGSIGSEWAAELAPRYTPGLNIVGAAIGGIPVHLAHNLRYVNGSPVWSSVAAGALAGIARGYNLRLGTYLTDKGRKIVSTVRHECIGEFSGAWPGLRISDIVKPRYLPIFQVPIFQRTVNRLIMGTAPGHPTAPLFMMAGDHDGTGDDVMIVGDQEALAHEYCTQGVDVDFNVVQGQDHSSTGLVFLASGQAWLASRFAGVPAPNNCASVGRGNSLAPVH